MIEVQVKNCDDIVEDLEQCGTLLIDLTVIFGLELKEKLNPRPLFFFVDLDIAMHVEFPVNSGWSNISQAFCPPVKKYEVTVMLR